MLAQSQLEMCFENCDGGGGEEEEEYLDFSGGNLLDSIDFDDFFVGINDEDVLPDLEMDPEILVEFSDSGGDEYSQPTTATSVSMEKLQETPRLNEEDVDKGINTSSDISTDSTNFRNKKDLNPTAKKGEERRKSSKQSSRNAHGKRKVKVDWTPELHRRFVQAVEQLGVDKAVPSRILELMGIDCLTRHNIASHLQKYRSHRKNLLAREAEATSWSQKRQLYNAPAGGKRVMNPWHTPTIGFPPPMAAPPPQIHPHFRPLHVWGHPSINQPSMQHVWSKHLGAHAPPLQPPTWPSVLTPQPPPPPSPSDHSFWNSQQRHVSNSLAPGMPYFPPHLTPARFPAQPVPGIPPATMYRLEPGIGVPVATPGQAIPQPPVEFHPSKESIDAAIGDVISKPWLPLPLGLKPPCVDGVLVELQRQGIPKIPPGTAV